MGRVKQALSAVEKQIQTPSTMSHGPSPTPSLLQIEETCFPWHPKPRNRGQMPASPLSPPLGVAALTPAERITMRWSSRPNAQPTCPLAGNQPFQERLGIHLNEHIYGRTQYPIRAGASGPFFADRPKAENSGGYVGSPLVLQRVHGVQPLLFVGAGSPTEHTHEGAGCKDEEPFGE